MPRTLFTPVAPKAYSTVLVLPKITAPALFKRCTIAPSGPVICAVSRSEPLVVGMPSTAIMSLIPTGTPIKGPRSVPLANRPSIARAAAMARSASTY